MVIWHISYWKELGFCTGILSSHGWEMGCFREPVVLASSSAKRDADLKFPLQIELSTCLNATVRQDLWGFGLHSLKWLQFICLSYSFLSGLFVYSASDHCWEKKKYSTEQNLPFLSACPGPRNTACLISHWSDLPWRYEQYFHTENLIAL